MHSLLRGLGQDGHRVGGGRGFSSCASWNVPVWSDVARVANCVTGTGRAPPAGIQRGGRERYSKVGCEFITIQVFTIIIQVSNLFKNL